MNTLELMDATIPQYSKTDRAIYEAIRKLPDSFANDSVTQIAENSHFSKPALTRFAKRLGFGGFVEFQFQLRQDLQQARGEGHPTNAQTYADLLMRVEETMDLERLRALAERMEKSPRVFVLGFNLSRLPAEELNMAMYFHPRVFCMLQQQDVFYHYRPDDLLIVYSAINGSTHKDLVEMLAAHLESRPHMVLVTASSRHPLRKHFDEVFVVPTASLSSSTHAVLSDTFAFLMFNDLLVSLLDERDQA